VDLDALKNFHMLDSTFYHTTHFDEGGPTTGVAIDPVRMGDDFEAEDMLWRKNNIISIN
jgi:hypothetical protein